MRLLETYRGSRELKKAVIQRSFDLGIPFKHICRHIGVDYSNFMAAYINSSNGDKAKITEDQFSDMLEILGIKTTFQFIIDTKYDPSEIKAALKEKYDKE